MKKLKVINYLKDQIHVSYFFWSFFKYKKLNFIFKQNFFFLKGYLNKFLNSNFLLISLLKKVCYLFLSNKYIFLKIILIYTISPPFSIPSFWSPLRIIFLLFSFHTAEFKQQSQSTPPPPKYAEAIVSISRLSSGESFSAKERKAEHIPNIDLEQSVALDQQEVHNKFQFRVHTICSTKVLNQHFHSQLSNPMTHALRAATQWLSL